MACRAELLIKWEGLGYDELSWEKAADLTDVEPKVAALKARQPMATKVGPAINLMLSWDCTPLCLWGRRQELSVWALRSPWGGHVSVPWRLHGPPPKTADAAAVGIH